MLKRITILKSKEPKNVKKSVLSTSYRTQEEFLSQWTSHVETYIEKYGLWLDRTEIFLWKKKDWQWEFGLFFFSSRCTKIATSYWDYPPGNNIHLEVELRIHLQSY